jgi:hypothetical protein
VPQPDEVPASPQLRVAFQQVLGVLDGSSRHPGGGEVVGELGRLPVARQLADQPVEPADLRPPTGGGREPRVVAPPW